MRTSSISNSRDLLPMNIYRLATRILTLSYAYLCDRSGFKGVPRTLSSKWPQLVLVKVVILRLSDLRNK